MKIEIRNADSEARIQEQLQATRSTGVEGVLHRLHETQEEQDRWLLENREAIDAKIGRGIDQLHRGQGIPEDHLGANLANLKAMNDGGTFCAGGGGRPSRDPALHCEAKQR